MATQDRPHPLSEIPHTLSDVNPREQVSAYMAVSTRVGFFMLPCRLSGLGLFVAQGHYTLINTQC